MAFQIKEEVLTYSRYLKVWSREVKYPNGMEVSWDVVGHSTSSPAFAVIFPYNTETVRYHYTHIIDKKTTQLIREYCQGTNELVNSKNIT